MSIEIAERCANDLDVLAEYARVSIAFPVISRLAIRPVKGGIGGLLLVEEPLPTPHIKDYDARDGDGPTRWRDAFDLRTWGVLLAYADCRLIGGATLAWNTTGVDMLEGRADLAVLWDLRVHPDARQQGIGHRLFTASEAWAKARGCRELKIETQNNNVAACRFYARQGCVLQTIRQNVYADLPDEAQLIWRKPLYSPLPMKGERR